jgi:Spy/CpxP family protein refolding chaperone
MKATHLVRMATAVVVLAGITATSVAAQDPPPRNGRQASVESRVEARLQFLGEKLDLTQAQIEQIRGILQANAGEMRERMAQRRSAADRPRDAQREQMREHMEQVHSQIEAVLTPEQREAFRTLWPDGRRPGPAERGAWGAGRRGGGPMGAGLLQQLNLTDAQQTQLRELWTSQRGAMRAWMEANPNATREQRAAQFELQAERVDAAIQRILTPAQLEEYRSLRDEAPVRSGAWGRRGVGPMAGALGQRLDLTEAQQSQLQEVWTAQREQMRAWLQANPDATREERAAQLSALATRANAAIEDILTPDQLEAYRNLRMQRGERFRDGRGRRGPATGSSDATAPARSVAPTNTLQADNYPNPFNPTTEIRFTLPAASQVTLSVYDAQGREVAKLLDSRLDAGSHQATFDATSLPSGVYLYQITAGAFHAGGQMVLMK